jgi:hypothetical protein
MYRDKVARKAHTRDSHASPAIAPTDAQAKAG